MRADDYLLAFCPLASGSKGNAYWVETGGLVFLVDVGISYRNLSRRVEEIGRSLDQVEHVFITHEHSDHIHGLRQLLKKNRPVVWATRGTLRALREVIPDGASVRMINDGRGEMDGMMIRAIPVQHDARNPVAYRFDTGSGSLAVVTDLGRWRNSESEALRGLDLLVCETNHDPHMLRHGPYPAELKQRIASPLGHLSNEEGAQLVTMTAGWGTRHFVLAHLSEQNNSPSLALDVVSERLDEHDIAVEIEVASQSRPGPWIEVGNGASGN